MSIIWNTEIKSIQLDVISMNMSRLGCSSLLSAVDLDSCSLVGGMSWGEVIITTFEKFIYL
jgi:hypothetical protein